MKKDNTHYIYFDKAKDKFTVIIRVKGERIYIGTYNTVDEARSNRDKYLKVIEEEDIPKSLPRKRDLMALLMSFKEDSTEVE